MRLLLPASFLAMAAPLTGAEGGLSFNRDIRPILSDKCIGCHGPDAAHREAGLRLDVPEGAFAPLQEGEGFAIVAGKPEKSAILRRIDSKDEDEVMPPPKTHKTVNAAERALLERWIREGATYEPHWSYATLKRPEVPTVKGRAANPIDTFILADLEELGIQTSPPAAPNELLRRVHLDLTGLPPDPAALDAFERDPASYQNVVEALLASPRHGERMAVPWLDAVRYADTVGFHGDQNVRIFAFRDYVIRSFQENKPFDAFVREQLAGDLLPDATPEQLVASGFNRLNLMTREGGAQPKEYLAKSAADRVRAVGTAFLGQTTGCAECHDHKYDPITARDFYSLGAFFDDVQQWGVYADYNYTPNPDLKGYNNDFPFPPELICRSPSLLDRLDRLESELIAELANTPPPAGDRGAWLSSIKTFAANHPDGWLPLRAAAATSSKQTPAVIQEDGSVLLQGSPRKDDELVFDLGAPGMTIGALRVEALPDPTNANQVGRSAGGRFTLSPAIEWVDAAGKATPVKISFAQADLLSHAAYSNGNERLVGFGATWTSAPGRHEYPASLASHPHTAVLCLEAPLDLPEGARLVARIKSADVGRLRFAATPALHPVPGRAAFSARFLTTLGVSPAADHLCLTPEAKLSARSRELLTGIRLCRAGWTRSLVTVSLPADKRRVSRVLPRGDWQNESGEVVKPAVPGFLPSASLPKDRPLTRLDLANWITAAENPLTARHYVNRLWKQFFGRGISNVLDDLGGQGEPPSHPELLDWLACEFRDSGWDTRHMVRLIVSSHAYQQQAARRADLAESDPSNRLLARQSARRLDAEFVRDNALAIAGLLDVSYAGGPSVKPYQPPGYYTAIQFPDRDYLQDPHHAAYRRGLYMHWQRTFLHPMLANFDAPSREECAADRTQSNTPQQALTLLNDPVFLEAAEALAKRVGGAGGVESSIRQAFRLAVSRDPIESELRGLMEFYQKQLAAFQSGENQHASADPAQAALGQTCRVILNLHETITRY
jgi:hypothetical protein